MDSFELEEHDSNFISQNITLNSKKTCIGKKKYVYNLKKKLEKDFLNLFYKYNSKINYPLGEAYKLFSIDCPKKFVITGFLEDTEISLVLRLNSSLKEKKEFEVILISYTK